MPAKVITPAGLGFRMPAEWEKHQATWLSWPKDPNTFPPAILGAVEKTFVAIIKALAGGEEVRVLVDDEATEARVKGMLEKLRGSKRESIAFLMLKTTDVWVRDYAPICVCRQGSALDTAGRDRGRVALTKWKFNAWGNKYDDLMPDDEAGRRIAHASGLRVFEPGMVLEGGSVDVNGRGTIMTTEQCLLGRNRNPNLGKAAIESRLEDYLGVTNVVWLGSGIEGDDTDGHIDDMARFVSPKVVVVAKEDSVSDQNHLVLEENVRRLRDASDQDGNPFEVVYVPMPSAITTADGRLPASHLNFYIGNSAVLVPTFDSPTDSRALGIIRNCFPDRDVIGIDCRALVYGLGTIHCVTQQVPAG